MPSMKSSDSQRNIFGETSDYSLTRISICLNKQGGTCFRKWPRRALIRPGLDTCRPRGEYLFGTVAQWLERRPFKPGDGGSTPPWPTIQPRRTTIQLIVLFKSGDPEVHRTECPDWPHVASHGGVTLDVESLLALATEVASDFLDDGSMTEAQAMDWLRDGLKPCAAGLPE